MQHERGKSAEKEIEKHSRKNVNNENEGKREREGESADCVTDFRVIRDRLLFVIVVVVVHWHNASQVVKRNMKREEEREAFYMA